MPLRRRRLQQEPHSDCRCIACVPVRYRHVGGGFDRDRRHSPTRTVPLGRKRAACTTSTTRGGGKLGRSRRRIGHLTLSLTAASLPRLLSISYSMVCPSLRELRPACSTAEMWTNTSLPPPPPVGWMNP